MHAGNYITAAAHIVTAVIGSGVLSLAWATSTMGWIAGPIILLMFSAVTWYCAWLLADAYRQPRDTGKRTYTYPGAVEAILGTVVQWPGQVKAKLHISMQCATLQQKCTYIVHILCC